MTIVAPVTLPLSRAIALPLSVYVSPTPLPRRSRKEEVRAQVHQYNTGKESEDPCQVPVQHGQRVRGSVKYRYNTGKQSEDP